MGALLVRGADRKRLKKLLTALESVQTRDGNVIVVDDPGDFRGQLAFDDSEDEGVSESASQVHDRLVDLLAARV